MNTVTSKFSGETEHQLDRQISLKPRTGKPYYTPPSHLGNFVFQSIFEDKEGISFQLIFNFLLIFEGIRTSKTLEDREEDRDRRSWNGQSMTWTGRNIFTLVNNYYSTVSYLIIRNNDRSRENLCDV